MKRFNKFSREFYSNDYDYSKIVNRVESDIRKGFLQWQYESPEELEEAIGELNQGKSCEAYSLVLNFMTRIISDIREVPRSILLSEMQKFYFALE